MTADELRRWDGRQRLLDLARRINPTISEGDHDDVVGFLAACLCALDRGKNPPALLLDFVRRRAWKCRGLGGIDGHWISKAKAAMREKQAERQRPRH